MIAVYYTSGARNAENEMTIQFQCVHCQKEVQAPDAAGGKRGKCPFCGTSNYIPAPVKEEDAIPLAPLDDEDERRRKKEVEDLLRQERELLAETGGQPADPKEDSGGVSKQELRALVVKYCRHMHAGKLPKAEADTDLLREQGSQALGIVDDFMTGKEIDPDLANIPGGLLQGFLRQLKQQIQQQLDS
jgi:hypothetical protein